MQEYEASHLSDAVHAPGGQVVQATDEFIGVRNARIVLVDNDGIRATMTASWLIQMGQSDVRILSMEATEQPMLTGTRKKTTLGLDENVDVSLDVAGLKTLLAQGALVLDLSLSSAYRQGHIEAAWFVLRSQLNACLAAITKSLGDEFHSVPALILTSSDGELANLCVEELQAITDKPVHRLSGGNQAWQRAGEILVRGEDKFSVEPIDIWRIPFVANSAKGETVEDAMRAYLDWEVDLMHQLARDGSTRFQHFPNEADS